MFSSGSQFGARSGLRRLARTIAGMVIAALASVSHTPAANAQACQGAGLLTGTTAYTQKATGTAATGSTLPFGAELGSSGVNADLNTVYCVDYTIHTDNGANADVGYVEFALLVKKTSNTNPQGNDPGNLQVIDIMPTVYYTDSGVVIPSGGSASSFASAYTLTSGNVILASGLTADADDGMIRGNQATSSPGLQFRFLTPTTISGTVTVNGFTSSNNPQITVTNNTSPCASTCDLASTYSTTVEFLQGNDGATLSNPIGFGSIGPVPEIDGARLPQTLLLLSTLYLLVFRRRQQNLSVSRA